MLNRMSKITMKMPGRVYQKYNVRDGVKVFQTTWTVRYKGKDYATGETDARKAKQFLMTLAAGVTPVAAPLKPFAAALAAAATAATVTTVAVNSLGSILDKYVDVAELGGLKVWKVYRGMANNHLKPFFGAVPADDLTTSLITTYKKTRLKTVSDPAKVLAKGATVNRELALLKSALKYGRDVHSPALLVRFPQIEMLAESKPRKGFLSHLNYHRLRMAMPDYWEPVFVTAYHVGRRRGELLQLEIDDVYMEGDSPEVRVPGDITKNGKPSAFPIYRDMTEVLRKQIEMTRRKYPHCKLLFHKNGKPIQKNQTFYNEWNEACAKAGVPGLLGHDLRRTACKLLIDSGMSRKQAMEITGHLTESAFNRYHIVDQDSMKSAVAKVTAFLDRQAIEAPAAGLVS